MATFLSRLSRTWDKGLRESIFSQHSAGARVELAGTRTIFTLSQQNAASPHSITFQWMAAHGPGKAAGENELSGRTNYLVGDPSHWLRGIKNYGRVRYASIYPNVDLVYYGNQRKLSMTWSWPRTPTPLRSNSPCKARTNSSRKPTEA